MIKSYRGGMMNLLSKLTLGLICLFLIAIPSVLAANELAIEDVDFDDPYHAGDSFVVGVTLANVHATRDIEDIEIKAWIEDDGDRLDRKVTYDVVRLQEDDEEDISLMLSFPRDVLPGTYLLRVTAEGKLDGESTVSDSRSYELEVEQEEHSVEILEILAPVKTRAGSFDASVLLFNSGANNEQDVRVTLEIPELDVKKTISLLRGLREGEEYRVHFKIVVPDNVAPGVYTLEARVGNADFTADSEAYIEVVGQGLLLPNYPNTVLTPDTKTVEIGKGGVFVLNMQNNVGIAKRFSFELVGTQDWTSSARVDPEIIILDPGESQEVLVYVMPSSASVGAHTFTVYVKDGSEIIGSEQLTANVVSGSSVSLDSVSAVVLAIVFLVVLYAVSKNYDLGGKKPSKKKSAEEIYY